MKRDFLLTLSDYVFWCNVKSPLCLDIIICDTNHKNSVDYMNKYLV